MTVNVNYLPLYVTLLLTRPVPANVFVISQNHVLKNTYGVKNSVTAFHVKKNTALIITTLIINNVNVYAN